MAGRKSGGADLELWRQRGFNGLESIRRKLIGQRRIEAAATNEQLAQLGCQLIQWQEDVLGAFSPRPRPFVRLPASVFCDYSVGGALHTVFETLLSGSGDDEAPLRSQLAAGSGGVTAELFGRIRAALRAADHIRSYRVFVHSSVSASNAATVRDIVTAHDGLLTDEHDTADFIVQRVDGDPERYAPEPRTGKSALVDGPEFLRTRDKRDRLALVHWWYYPDSYDAWIPSDAVEGEGEEEDAAVVYPAFVSQRFIFDLDKFNEWMNPIDYEIESPLPLQTTAAAAKPQDVNKRRQAISDSFSNSPPTRLAPTPESTPVPSTGDKSSLSSALTAVPSSSFTTLSPASRVSSSFPFNSSSSSSSSSSSYGATSSSASERPSELAQPALKRARSHSDRSAADVVAILPSANKDDVASRAAAAAVEQAPRRRHCGDPCVTRIPWERLVDARSRVRPSRRSGPPVFFNLSDAVMPDDAHDDNDGDEAQDAPADAEHVVAAPAASWFDAESIHDIERLALPEFFSGAQPSKTPHSYRHCRNFMVLAYRRNPLHRLTQAACRRCLPAHVGSVARIHAFLEHWGLINAMLRPNIRPLTAESLHTAALADLQALLHWPAVPAAQAFRARLNPSPRFPLHPRTAFSNPPLSQARSSDESSPSTASAVQTSDDKSFVQVQSSDDKSAVLSDDQSSVFSDDKASIIVQTSDDSSSVADEKSSSTSDDSLSAAGQRSAVRTPDECGTSASVSDDRKIDCVDDDDGDIDDDDDEAEKTSARQVLLPRFTCDACKAECGIASYQSGAAAAASSSAGRASKGRRAPVANVCVECFARGRLPVGMTSDEFEKREMNSEQALVEPWTDRETLLLLEALELYKEDWDKVASLVGSKTKEQCVAQFLRLPIEDKCYDNDNDNDNAAQRWRTTARDVRRHPFAQAANPVMAMVTFLAASVDTEIGAAAADAALNVILQKTAGAVSPHGAELGKLADYLGVDVATPSNLEEATAVGACVGLAVAAQRAKLLADHEKREVRRFTAIAWDLQLKKLELKLAQLKNIEDSLASELASLAQARNAKPAPLT